MQDFDYIQKDLSLHYIRVNRDYAMPTHLNVPLRKKNLAEFSIYMSEIYCHAHTFHNSGNCGGKWMASNICLIVLLILYQL